MRIDTVELDENTVNPLDAVLEQLEPEGTGPVMIVGLEKAVSSAEPDHPVLFNLNLSRPEWPRKVPRPVVLWVPEYVLGFLGREAPDFLDWRSDTLYFPEPTDWDYNSFDSSLWMGGRDVPMPEASRRARVAELQARLAIRTPTNDPHALVSATNWLREVGSHLHFLGDLEKSEEAFKEALNILEKLKAKEAAVDTQIRLGAVELQRGRISQAEKLFSKAIIALGPREKSAASALARLFLGMTYHLMGRQSEAAAMVDEAQEIIRGLGKGTEIERGANYLEAALLSIKSLSQEKTGTAPRIQALRAAERGDLETARDLILEALTLDQELGSVSALEADYRDLSQILVRLNELEESERALRMAIEIGEKAGSRDRANSYLALGHLYERQGKWNHARGAWTRARDLYNEMTMVPQKETVQLLLDALPQFQPRSGEGIEPGTSVPGDAHPPSEKP